MSPDQLTNLPASVKQRLLNLSRKINVEFNVLLTKYALERFLYRLGASRFRPQFVLKGALLFSVWCEGIHRTTRDADVLSLRPLSFEKLETVFREICDTAVEPDGLEFPPESVHAEEIRRMNVFGGIRITITGELGKAVIPLQVDVGFGDACVPAARTISYPVLLDLPAPRLRVYARETMIAEKFQAMVNLGMRNSRMKDYFDIFFLSRKFAFDGKKLATALAATFKRQGTRIPMKISDGLSNEFAIDPKKRVQWNSFLIQTSAMNLEADFAEVVAAIGRFIMPPARAAARGSSLDKRWSPGGPWRRKEKRHDG
jgi:predicted nucleotidyltransferase component of viral defense system